MIREEPGGFSLSPRTFLPLPHAANAPDTHRPLRQDPCHGVPLPTTRLSPPMPPPSLLDELHDARTRWLAGDANAWPDYLACCRRLDATSRPPSPERSAASPQRAVRRRSGRGTARRRGRRVSTPST